MSRYELASVDAREKPVSLDSTSPELIEHFLGEAKRAGLKLAGESPYRLGTGEPYRIYFLGWKETEMLWWLCKQLCLLGWEPFAASPPVHPDGNAVYHFRKPQNGTGVHSVDAA